MTDALSVGTTMDIGDHTIEVTENPTTTGDRYRVHIVAEPGGPGIKGDFPHSHPIIIETFTCVSGEMSIRAGKDVSPLEPGATAVVQPGVVHGFLNTGSCDLIVDGEVIFPNGYKVEDDLLRLGVIYDALRSDGEPSLLRMAVLVRGFRHVIHQPGLGGALLPPLAALGRLRGYRPV